MGGEVVMPIVRKTVMLVAAVAAATVSVPAQARADTVSDRYEQYRYALETLNLTYDQYVARQDDFRADGCSNGPAGCRKPAPYNAFDWTDDGCSGAEQIGFVSNVYRNLFNKPCRLHDFGYRNFGKGLTLYRNETMRLQIDNRLKTEMIRLCDNSFQGWIRYANWAACQNEATVVYIAVRHLSNWGTSGSPPAAPGMNPAAA